MSEPIVYSGEYWRTRTPEQLQEIADGSFRGGDAYEGAISEISKREDASRHAKQLFWTRLTFWTAAILGVCGIAATIFAAFIQADR